jgi:hypothetical protein
MIQQINLYQFGDQDDSDILHNPYLLAILASIFLLFAISAFNLVQLYNHQETKQQLQMQLQAAQSSLQQLQVKYPKQQIDNGLNQQLQQTRGYYQNLSQIIELFSNPSADRNQGFSGYFSALAEQADNQVWLTGIHIDNEDDEITLSGSTFKPDQIPLLFQRLQHTSIFKGKHFARLDVRPSELTQDLVDFTVSTKSDSEKEQANANKH